MLPSGDSATSFPHSGYSASWRMETVTSATFPPSPFPFPFSDSVLHQGENPLPRRNWVVKTEHGLISAEPRVYPLAEGKSSRAPRRKRRIPVVIGIDHVATHLVVPARRDRETEGVPV